MKCPMVIQQVAGNPKLEHVYPRAFMGKLMLHPLYFLKIFFSNAYIMKSKFQLRTFALLRKVKIVQTS